MYRFIERVLLWACGFSLIGWPLVNLCLWGGVYAWNAFGIIATGLLGVALALVQRRNGTG